MRRVAVILAASALLTAAGAATAQAGQIVYDHGPEIWVMNDDGSGQRPLLNVSQVPGMTTIGHPNVFPNGGTAVTFEGTTLAYAAPAGSGPAGACGINCTGVYKLAGGAIARLSPEPAPCGPEPQWCGSFDISPAWMANGDIAFENDLYAWEYSCLYFPCSWTFSASKYDIDVIPPTAGAGLGTTWELENSGSTIDGQPDPADASKLSYLGNLVNCEPECLYPLYVSRGSGEYEPVAYDDNLIQASWSPDGTRFADVEGGGTRGIWTYPSNGEEPFVWALEDPLQNGEDPGENPFDVTFKDVAWIGTSRVVFSADGNLWTIPASCGEAGAPSNPCHFPADATQLTFDGTSEAPNAAPSWTSATSPLVSPPAGGASTGGGPTPTPAPTPTPQTPPAGAASAHAAHAKGGSLTIPLSCAGTGSQCVLKAQLVVVEKLRGSHVVAIQAKRGHHKLRKRTVVIGTATLTLSGGQARTLKVKLNKKGRKLLARYHKLHAKLKVTQTVGSSTKTIRTQTVTLKAAKKHKHHRKK